MIDFDIIKKQCIKSFPNAKDETEALCLMVSYLRGVQYERIDLMNINAKQAQMIAGYYAELDRLRSFGGDKK